MKDMAIIGKVVWAGRRFKYMKKRSAYFIFLIIFAGCSNSPSIGEEAILHCEGGADKLIMVTIDKDTYDEAWKAQRINDTHGLLELNFKLFLVNNNTKVKVLDMDFGKRRVRILEGDKEGLAGWVPEEWVIKQQGVKKY
jgi:hypothetical protein